MYAVTRRRMYPRRKLKNTTKGYDYELDAICKRGDCGSCRECDRMSYLKKLSLSLKNLREEGHLCDISLRGKEGPEIKVHSFLICAVSSVLKAKIMEEKSPTLSFSNVSNEALQSVIDFIYTGNAHLTEKNVEDVLEFSKRYAVQGLVNTCENFMGDNLCVDNCLSYSQLAKSHDLRTLEHRARTFILVNWSQIWRNNAHFDSLLNVSDLMSFLKDDGLNIDEEEEIIDMVAKWIEFDPDKRQEDGESLLSTMRLTLNRQLSLGMVPVSYYEKNQHLFRSRIPRKLIFTIGGWSCGNATCDVEVYDNKAKLWILSLIADNVPRAYHGVAVVSGIIYLIGGYNGVECFRSMRSFNPVMYSWMECNSMYEPRCYISVAVLDDIIYALGGFDGLERKSSCEKFEPEFNQWSMMVSMNCIRSDASAAAFQGKIFICGGYDGETVISSTELYDPETDQWTVCVSMPDPRSGHRLVEFKGTIYLLGGFNGTNRLHTMYRYSHLQDQWIQESPMLHSRSNFATVTFGDQLLVIGGFDGQTIVTFVEAYDAEQRCWSAMESLNIPRSALAACVIEDIPNTLQYSANGPHGKITLAEYQRYFQME